MEGDRKDSIQEQIKDLVVKNLRRVYDPEINLNIYDLGLIYNVEVDEDANVSILMTLTSPNCPAAEILPMEAEFATRAVQGVNSVKLRLTFDPPWNPNVISDEAKYQLGIL